VAVVWWLGAYALMFGVVMVVLGFRLRSLHRAMGSPRELPTEGLRQRV
jgi:hypothetical protein